MEDLTIKYDEHYKYYTVYNGFSPICTIDIRGVNAMAYFRGCQTIHDVDKIYKGIENINDVFDECIKIGLDRFNEDCVNILNGFFGG